MSNKPLRTTPPWVPRRKPLGLSTFIGLLLVTTMVLSTTAHILDVEPLFKFDDDHRNTPTLRTDIEPLNTIVRPLDAPPLFKLDLKYYIAPSLRIDVEPLKIAPAPSLSQPMSSNPNDIGFEGDFRATHRLING